MKKAFLCTLAILVSGYSHASVSVAPEIANDRKGPCYEAALVALKEALKEWDLIESKNTIDSQHMISATVTDLNIFAPMEGVLLTARTVSKGSKGGTVVAHWTAPIDNYRHNSLSCTVGKMTIAIEDDFLSGGGGVSVHN